MMRWTWPRLAGSAAAAFVVALGATVALHGTQRSEPAPEPPGPLPPVAGTAIVPRPGASPNAPVPSAVASRADQPTPVRVACASGIPAAATAVGEQPTASGGGPAEEAEKHPKSGHGTSDKNKVDGKDTNHGGGKGHKGKG